MWYIQRRDKQFNRLETVDECEEKKEAIYLVEEYQLSDRAGRYYISTRPCKEWRER